MHNNQILPLEKKNQYIIHVDKSNWLQNLLAKQKHKAKDCKIRQLFHPSDQMTHQRVFKNETQKQCHVVKRTKKTGTSEGYTRNVGPDKRI